MVVLTMEWSKYRVVLKRSFTVLEYGIFSLGRYIVVE